MPGAESLFDQTPRRDDSPDVAQLVAKFTLEQEKLIHELREHTDKNVGALNTKQAVIVQRIGELSVEVEKMRRVFEDLQATARKTTAEMVHLLTEATAAAAIAKSSAQVYERMVDARPDLLKRIEEVNTRVAGYRTEVKQLGENVTQLGKAVDNVKLTAADFQTTKRAIETLSQQSRPVLTAPPATPQRKAR